MFENNEQTCTGYILVIIFSVLFVMLWIAQPVWGAVESLQGVKKEKRVVVLYSQPRDFPATEMVEKGVRDTLAGETRFAVQLYSEYLDLSRFRDNTQRQALADLLHQRYGGEKIDLIICVDVPAAYFLMEYGEHLFSSIPVVMCSIPEALTEQLLVSSLQDRVSGVVEPEELAQQLVQSALRFKPGTKNAVLIAGAFENDEIRAVALRKALKAIGERVRLIDLTRLGLGEILARCETLPEETLIFYSTLFVDAKGRSFVPKNVLQSIAAVSERPIFGPYESYIGHGIVGGPLISLRFEGMKAAEMALRILHGQPPKSRFFIGRDTHRVLYDWRQLKRHHIDEHLLPIDGTVLFREATLWEQYKLYIVGTVVLLALQSVLIVGLIFNLRHRKLAETALRASQQELQTLAGRLISSQEEELSRLSREFHDDYAQRLAAVAIETGTLEMQIQHLAPPAPEKIGHIREQLINLSEDIHALSRELHPAILSDLGLARAIRSLCLNFADREDLQVSCHIDELPEDINAETALCVYRVIQESLRNIAKHARARHVDLFLKQSKNRLLATIEDDGVGFEPRCVRRTPGIGLASMRERVQYVNGEFTIRSEPGQGTVIDLSVPL